MKRLLLLVTLVLFTFSIAGCSGTVDQITDITDQITSISDQIDELDTDLSGLSDVLDDIASLQDSIGELDGDVEGLQDLLDRVNTIQSGLTVVKTNIMTINGDISELEPLIDQVAALEMQIAALMNEDTVGNWANLLQTEIVFMYNNDVHGRVNDDSYAGTMGYATIKNLVDEIRANYDNSYFIAAGDMVHGTTFATLEEGSSVIEVMNEVGYDIMVAGNHDFDYGQDRLLELVDLADFPIISSNIQYDLDDSDFLAPYILENFGDVTVGFFGVTTPDTTYMTHPDNVIGLNFLDPVTQAELYVAELEDQGADIIVMLSHLGTDESSSVTSEDVAEAVDGIDVIIDGHSHTYLPHTLTVNDTIILSTGEYNKNLGVFSFVVEDGEIISFNNLLISANEAVTLGYGEDAEVQAVIDAISAGQEAILNVVVGQTPVELDGVRDNVRTGGTNLGNLITDSMLDVTGADIALTNGGGIRASIEAGEVTRGDIITVLPFGNIIVTIELTGAQIVAALEHGTSSYPSSSGKFPHVAGMTFTINENNAAGSRVENVMIDGVAIDLGATYVVATNDFTAAGGDGYTMFLEGTKVGEFMGLHEALESMFTVGVDIVVPVDTRITVIPVT